MNHQQSYPARRSNVPKYGEEIESLRRRAQKKRVGLDESIHLPACWQFVLRRMRNNHSNQAPEETKCLKAKPQLHRKPGDRPQPVHSQERARRQYHARSRQAGESFGVRCASGSAQLSLATARGTRHRAAIPSSFPPARGLRNKVGMGNISDQKHGVILVARVAPLMSNVGRSSRRGTAADGGRCIPLPRIISCCRRLANEKAAASTLATISRAAGQARDAKETDGRGGGSQLACDSPSGDRGDWIGRVGRREPESVFLSVAILAQFPLRSHF